MLTVSDRLRIDRVAKSFDTVSVLKDISLVIPAGTILGLAGENGAGKSTLAKCITGLLKPDSGTIECNGSCAMIPQEFCQIPELKVYENIFLGRELSRFGILQKKEMIRKSQELLRSVGSSLDPCRPASSLSVAEKQMLEIAKAFLVDSKLLIMDEPTTVLSREEVQVLFGIMRKFKADGGSIIYVSHKLKELLEICDLVAVMRDGILISCTKAFELTPRDIASAMVGRNLSKAYPPKLSAPASDAEVALEVKDIHSGKQVNGVSFSLKKGEFIGIAGLAGAGRTELAEAICGFRRRTGRVSVFGKKLHRNDPGAAMKAGLTYLSEDRQGTAILRDFDLIRNTTLASLSKYCSFGFIGEKACRDSADLYRRKFKIKAENLRTKLKSLSGGNQQKVAIAKGLDTNPKVFIFDEPTRGVDVGARRDIYDFIRELALSGIACIMISSDLEEIIGNCRRVLVMSEGKIAGEVTDENVTEQNIMYSATGVKEKKDESEKNTI